MAFLRSFSFYQHAFFGVAAVVVSSLINQRVGSYFGGAIWSRINAFFTPMIVRVEGKENIHKATSYVIISNHQSVYDIFLIYGWLGIDIKWIMKKELRRLPGVGFGSRKVGHIFLDRSNSRVALESLNEAKRKLVNGTSVVMFPEGTRSDTGELGSFKRGAFKLALDLGLPILPLTLIGTKNILPNKSYNLMPGVVKMIIHEPIDIKKYREDDIIALMQNAKEIIGKVLPKRN
ncbi:MAG: 1-acyl-sn-glycerol-3-phosphate acyltransferase [Bacteroidales bacterium]|nr:1-acyl-sn-glycerol-3-phosphate acyltransferase [Bacteroidales bacterium]